jgi:diguanylate cyclase (GGDEF)-like protein
LTPLTSTTTIEQWREERIVSILYNNGSSAIMGSVINIAIISAVLMNIYPMSKILIWFSAGEALNLVRHLIHKLYFRNNSLFESRSWLLLSRSFTTASGLIYGLLPIFFFNSDNHLYQMLVILLPAGMAAAAVGTHAIDLLTYRLFLLFAITPLVLRLLFEGTEAHLVTAAMLCLLMFIMLKAASQYRNAMIENIEMTYSLHYRATHDSLVGLLNRDEFKNIYDSEITPSPATKNIITSIIFIDLDNFKMLNDSLGHQAGDDALIKIGEIIRSSLRQSDTAARFGGDEFMILLQSDSIEQPKIVAQKIINRILDFQKKYDSKTKLGASIGIGYSFNHPPYNILLKAADQACYQAKSDGKGDFRLQEI